MIWRHGSTRRYLTPLVLSFSVFAAACSFHLRGAEKYEISPVLATLRVAVEGDQLQNDPLLVAVKNALRTQTDIRVEDSGKAPLLQLYGERLDSQVLSVDSTGKVEEYLLKYEVSFRLVGQDGKLLTEPQTVRVQRDQTFDRLNVLATERETEERRREMRSDAVQQILRRLARINLENSDANRR